MSKLLEMRYHRTYLHLQIVDGVLRDPFTYLRAMDDFFGDDRYKRLIHPFRRWSALHEFTYFVIDALDLEDLARGVVECQAAMVEYGVVHESFDDWRGRVGHDDPACEDTIVAYLDHLDEVGVLPVVQRRMTEEAFHLMFANRGLLHSFNAHAAHYVSGSDPSGFEEWERRLWRRRRAGEGRILKRFAPPEWAKRAVFHRDRGRCVFCQKDLSGTLSLLGVENYDHMVPLASGGLNDVTNLQLLCEACNQEKRDRARGTRNHVEHWYPMR